ncbi:MAG TPA: hypothetical protein VK858_19320 [Longimicrobiales bacterium]|nr:hypothetical protein [Longimicrobiales bacterium]
MLRPTLRAPLIALLIAAGTTACGPDDGAMPETLDRETFVAVMVELRKAALAESDATLRPSEREQILGGHGVTEEDLLTFAEVHGQDPTYMAEVWRDIETRLNVPIDSAGGSEVP